MHTFRLESGLKRTLPACQFAAGVACVDRRCEQIKLYLNNNIVNSGSNNNNNCFEITLFPELPVATRNLELGLLRMTAHVVERVIDALQIDSSTRIILLPDGARATR